MARRNYWYLFALFLANLALLLASAHPLRVAGALLLITVLPGLTWANYFLADSSLPLRSTVAAAISYTLVGLGLLLLHYLPGPVPVWYLLVLLNLVAILPLLLTRKEDTENLTPAPAPELHPELDEGLLPRASALFPHLPLLLILVIAIFLRVTNLSYSEFQGDEALAMISAAEALEGHEDALFLRAKGPGEVLLPMALWRLTGTISEGIARWPFTLAILFAIITIYLIGQTLGGRRIGWLAAGFFAFNGFMVAFGRIVQYQALVVWMSSLAFLMVLQWRRTHQQRFIILGGLFLGVGLLAHFDAVLVLPAIVWLLITAKDEGQPPPPFVLRPSSFVLRRLTVLLLFAIGLLLTALPFYLPYALDPQANRTGAYVGQRIGSELRNNLPDFFHFTTFYSSSYYLIISGLLLLIVSLSILWRAGTLGRFIGLLATLGIGTVVIYPYQFEQLAFLPFAILLFSVFLTLFFKKSSPLHPSPPASLQAVIIWLAVPFLGYNFIVALGLTHIYTTVPAWSLLAALAVVQLTINNTHTQKTPTPCRDGAKRAQAGTGRARREKLTKNRSLISQSAINNSVRSLRVGQFTIHNSQFAIQNYLITAFFLFSTLFLWNAFVRHDVEYWQDYPLGKLSIFWTPYSRPPQAGFFGFAHRTGWKVVGQKIAGGQLRGDYGSNEEPDVTTWYTRGAPRACDPQPEYYFLADDLIDPVPIPAEVIDTHYRQIGRITLPNQKQMQIMQQTPTTQTLGWLDEATLSQAFDASATPAAFARSARGALPVQANFGNLIQLIGYDLDTRRAYPGGRVPVTLYWQALASLSTSYQVFTHLESESGGPVAQSDGVPVCWSYPTDAWRPGQIIADQHAITISPDTPPGQYPLEIGLYLPDTFERLDVLDVAGNPTGTSVTLDMVEIGRLEIED